MKYPAQILRFSGMSKAGRPSIPMKDRVVKLSISLSPDLVRWIRRTAHLQGQSVSAFVGSVLRRSMRARSKKP